MAVPNVLERSAASVVAGKFDEATRSLVDHLRSHPNDRGALRQLIAVYLMVDKIEEAVAVARTAVEKSNGGAAERTLYGFTLLLHGDLHRGFIEFENRIAEVIPRDQRFDLPLWRGEWQPGLIVRGEQGFGDTIQMLRFVAEAADRVGKVYLIVRPELERLARAVVPIDISVLSSGRLSARNVGAWAPIMSLPGCLGVVDFHSFAERNSAYITVAPAEIAKGAIGICWASGKEDDQPDRNIPIEEFAPILACNNDIRIVSLARGLASPPGVDDLTPFMTDFLATAELIAGMRLVISCDTAVAHLAGAMGKPVILICNRRRIEWRWPRGQDRTPWYPSMRIFWRELNEPWSAVMARVHAALKDFAFISS